MIEPDESIVAVFRIEIGPVARQNVCVQIDFHALVVIAVSRSPLLDDNSVRGRRGDLTSSDEAADTTSEGLHRLRLRHFRSAFLAGATRIVVPEIEHRLTEMLNDIRAVKINVFHQGAAIVAIENDVFVLARRAATLDYDADRVRRPHRRMRNIRRDKERLTFADDVVDDAVAFANAHFDVAL